MADVARSSPIYRSLEGPVNIDGAEYRLVMMNVGVLLFMLMSLRFWWWIPVSYIIHILLKQLGRSDPQISKIYIRYSRQADRYDPWSPVVRIERRPNGFGRKSLC